MMTKKNFIRHLPIVLPGLFLFYVSISSLVNKFCDNCPDVLAFFTYLPFLALSAPFSPILLKLKLLTDGPYRFPTLTALALVCVVYTIFFYLLGWLLRRYLERGKR